MTEPLAGVRTQYGEMPVAVRRWVESELGSSVTSVVPRTGGMSPAVAASVAGAAGRRAFVKAVSADQNPDTPTHFRHELSVLEKLPPADYRARLLASYDDGHWVAMLLEDIDGPHPDWSSERDRESVYDAVLEQSDELRTPPDGLVADGVSDAMHRHEEAIARVSDTERAALPLWVQYDLDALHELARTTAARLPHGSFCHWDIRRDNILLRPSGQPVLVDWGMSRFGPAWGDVMVYALEWMQTPRFDELIARLGLSPEEDQDVTGFLASFGLYCAISGTWPGPTGLPNLPQWRADLGRRALIGVRRRLAR